MPMSDEDHAAILKQLDAANDGSWTRLASEINDEWDQVYFWFLVEGKTQAERSFRVASRVLRDVIPDHPATEFNLGFMQRTDTHMIDWEVVGRREVMSGRLIIPFGSRPDIRPLREGDDYLWRWADRT